MRQCRVFAAYLICLTVSLLASGLALAQESAAIPNASFEEMRGNRVAQWRPYTWGGQAEFQPGTLGHIGSRSVMIASEKGADAGWTLTVPVRPFSRYRLTGWIKTEDVKPSSGRGALFNLHNVQVATDAVTGTKDWTRVSMEFDTEDGDSIQINCLFGGWGLATGKAWYDDVNLEVIASAAPMKPAVSIDASQTGAPISKYIYGQFIEHLGRCIYGGIWAEMLEDRKFWYAVGAKESPWKAVGEGAKLEMRKEGAYVGEHSPVVTVTSGTASGLAHEGLGLVDYREYVGRVVLQSIDFDGAIDVSLISGPNDRYRETITIASLGNDAQKIPFFFKARGTTDNGRLEIAGRGQGSFRVGTASIMPADNILGMRRDTLALLKELDSPVYRWPGGNFVSGYDWMDGIGERDKRPPRKNPAWQGVEHNDFGMDEFMVFCRLLGTEPYIAVNSGLGGVTSAVMELQYANGAPDTEMGKLRAKNGHPEPYAVKFWGIGNEMYGNWQLGHMPLADYVKKHNEFAEAMRKADPSVQLVAVGAVGEWSRTMLANAADHMNLMSEHFYVQERPGLLSHVRQVPNNIRRIADAHREYRKTIPALAGKDIKIALDEWNYWYGPHVFGELGTRYFLKDGLGIAAGLNEYARNSDIYFMANYAQTVNVIGAIKTNKTAARFETTGLALALYRKHFGTIPVAVGGTPAPLDAAAAWTDDRKMLTVAIVNPTTEKIDVPIEVKGANLSGDGVVYLIAGSDPMIYNDPAEAPKVVIQEQPVKGVTNTLAIPPISVSLYRLEVK